jgi:hypothetical protein
MPICIPSKEFIDIGKIASTKINHKQVDTATKGQKLAIKVGTIFCYPFFLYFAGFIMFRLSWVFTEFWLTWVFTGFPLTWVFTGSVTRLLGVILMRNTRVLVDTLRWNIGR